MNQSLDETIVSPLLFARLQTDNSTGQLLVSQDFVHDTYRDFFLARYFAEEINSGKLSVREAYVNFWSYEEDAKLWMINPEQEWRSLLPAWKNMLLLLANQLDQGHLEELTSCLGKSYLQTLGKLGAGGYNPFEEDISFLAELATEITQEYVLFKIPTKQGTKTRKKDDLVITGASLPDLVRDLNHENPETVISAAEKLVKLGCFVPGLSRLLYSNNEDIVIAGVEAFGEFRIFHKRLEDFFDDESIRPQVIGALAKMGHYDPIFRDYLDPELDDRGIIAAVEALAEFDVFDDRFYDLLSPEHEERDFYLSVIDAFEKIKGYSPVFESGPYGDVMARRDDDPDYAEQELFYLSLASITVMGSKGIFDSALYSYLNNSSLPVKCAAISAFGKTRHYDHLLNELLKHESKKVRRAAAYALAKIMVSGCKTKNEETQITSTIVYQTLMDLMEAYNSGFKNDVKNSIKMIHCHLKPRGHNPKVKKLWDE